jgi:hypothetical protein
LNGRWSDGAATSLARAARRRINAVDARHRAGRAARSAFATHDARIDGDAVMKPICIAIASLAAFALAGCASTDARTSSRVIPERSQASIVADVEYVAKVESIARQRHMDVVWVNKPYKRVQRDE